VYNTADTLVYKKEKKRLPLVTSGYNMASHSTKREFHMIKVTFITKTGHQVIEMFPATPHAGANYELRAMALGWIVASVEAA